MFIKILSLFSAFALFTISSAYSAPEQPTKCFDKNDGYYNQNTGQGIIADYIIYFENKVGDTFPVINGQDCESQIRNELNSRFLNTTQDIQSILIFGSADNTGTDKTNQRLSQQRAQKVTDILSGMNISMNCDESGARCANVSIGDAIQRAMGRAESTTKTRGVYIFILNKRDACSDNDITLLKLLQKHTTSNSPVHQQLTYALQLCAKPGEELFTTERQKITDAELAAVELIKDKPEVINQIPNDLKIPILVRGLISTRTALAANTSVWKNAQGKFNVARLASDSIAGVVLGTAGGLITSHVVKKNQITKGFENIMCKIGGQTVSAYGDQFTVGITTK